MSREKKTRPFRRQGRGQLPVVRLGDGTRTHLCRLYSTVLGWITVQNLSTLWRAQRSLRTRNDIFTGTAKPVDTMMQTLAHDLLAFLCWRHRGRIEAKSPGNGKLSCRILGKGAPRSIKQSLAMDNILA
jgi:hypothetical protein